MAINFAICRTRNAHKLHAMIAILPIIIGQNLDVNTDPKSVRFKHRASAGDDGVEGERDFGTIAEVAEPELRRPPMYKVILLNDDYTPMEFVVHILENFFAMNREKATQIMLVVHSEGAAVVGIFPRDIAETKSEQVNAYAQENNHPLMSTVEMTD